ncbi:MAG: hypothetical protein ACKO6N_05510 [Myxococcota bacterium]
MILIANPLYDVVFKYLLEDLESARILLSNILDEEIIDLELRPQEQVFELSTRSLAVFRLDFAALIKTGPDSSKLVILEIQKAKLATDIMRFRRYLGKQYLSKENVYRTSTGEVRALPIVSIYFLAYDLGTLSPPVIRVKRTYQDVRTQEPLTTDHPFIESLTHDAIVVQLSKLKEPYQSELEKLLSIFDQHNRTGDGRELLLDETKYPEAYERLKARLLRANAEESMREQMDVEEEVLEELTKLEREVEARDKKLEDQDKKLEEQDKKLEEQDKKLEEKDKELQDQGKKLEEKDKELQDQGKKLEEQGKQLQDLHAMLAEQGRALQLLQQTLLSK